METIDAELLKEFLVECGENISQLDNDLVALEQNPGDLEILKKIFRAIHSVKGTCGMFGLVRLEKVAHAAEDVLGKMREGSLPASPQNIDPILKAIDIIKMILGHLESQQKEPDGDDSAVIDILHAIFNRQLPELQAPTTSPQPVSEDSVQSAQVVAPAPTPAPNPSTSNGAVPSTSVADQTLRVHVDIIDQLMNLVGELVLTRNQLVQLIRGVDESQFSNPIQQLNRVTSLLQESVLKTRMQPIGVVWSKLPRIVRDLAASSGKKLELQMIGQDTEMDRQILQAIGDPLVHLIRNAADHGIESPEQRLSKGKKPNGTIALKAAQEGGQIIISITDDGAGINKDIILKKAIEKGLVKADSAKNISESEILNLIFEPGFSTAKQITEVSGRGVGMDVVKSNIEKIGGNVEILTKLDYGSTMKITIPLTLAIISALIVRIGDKPEDVFALPQSNVLELVRISEDSINSVETIDSARFLRLRDSLLPLIEMRQILSSDDLRKDKDFSVVVCQIGENRFGLVTQEVFDTQEVVVKAPGAYLKEAGIFSGATILGDGRVILILDIAKIAELGLHGVAYAANQSSMAQAHANSAEFTERVQLLLLRSYENASMALPLSLVSRLEEIPIKDIEVADGKYFIQYRGSLLPILGTTEQWEPPKDGSIMSVIFSNGAKSLGLAVKDICDVVTCNLKIESAGTKLGILGTAIVENKVTEILDVYYFLVKAYPDWFKRIENVEERRQKRILVVDDSSFFRDLIKPVLESNGYNVSTAVDGEDALRVLDKQSQFDLILSDIEMPNKDGWELAGDLKQKGILGKIPIFALTSLNDDIHRNRAKDLGFTDYLIKFDQDQLLEAISKGKI